jgi:hypothetical protein
MRRFRRLLVVPVTALSDPPAALTEAVAPVEASGADVPAGLDERIAASRVRTPPPVEWAGADESTARRREWDHRSHGACSR